MGLSTLIEAVSCEGSVTVMVVDAEQLLASVTVYVTFPAATLAKEPVPV